MRGVPLCSRLNIPELRNALDRPAKGVIVKSAETEIACEVDYKPNLH